MLSDSLHEAVEIIWEAIENYDYSEEYKEDLVSALTKLGYIIYRLDRLKKDCVLSEEEYSKYVLERWNNKD